MSAVGLLAAMPALAQGPLERTDPRHLDPVPPGGYELPLAPPLAQFPLRSRVVVLNSLRAWNQTGVIDKDLSRECAERRFTEQTPMQYRAIFEKKDILGVAFADGTNLRDPGKKAKPGYVYLFRNGDSTGCVVVALTIQEFQAAQTQPAPTAGKKPGTAKPARGPAAGAQGTLTPAAGAQGTLTPAAGAGSKTPASR